MLQSARASISKAVRRMKKRDGGVRIKHILASAIWVVGVLAAPAIGRSQMGPGNGPGTPQTISGKHFGLDGFEMYTQDDPFQLVERVTTVRTKPDGATVTSETIRHVFRDSQGRFRVESGRMKDGVFQAREITIFDPVALIKVDFMDRATTGRLFHVQPRQLPTAEEEPAGRRAGGQIGRLQQGPSGRKQRGTPRRPSYRGGGSPGDAEENDARVGGWEPLSHGHGDLDQRGAEDSSADHSR